MARLWQDLRGQIIAEASEGHAVRAFVRHAVKAYGEKAVDIPLECLAIKIVRPVQRKSVPAYLRWKVWKRDNFTCLWCGERSFLEIDHVYPVSRGGRTTLENLQTLCQSCNSAKRDKVLL